MRCASPIVLAARPLALAALLLLGLAGRPALAGVLATGTLTRIYEPVIVSGATLPNFGGAATTSLWAYAYKGGAWVQIPFQVDQKDASGNYFRTDADPTFDANDEISFMARDMGDQVSADLWIGDADAQSHERYEVQVIDATNPSKRSWAYVYRSATLSQTFSADLAGYATISGADSVWGEGYSLVYNGGGVLVNTRLTPALGADNVDIVDRSKLRVTAKILFLTFHYTENDFSSRTIAVIDGPVRLLRAEETTSPSSTDTSYAAYYANLDVPLSPTTITSQITFLRGSVDLNPNAVGMHMYDTWNAAGATIDGVPDAGLNTAIPTWGEVTGAHGTIVSTGDATGVGGTQGLYYLDNSAVDANDTGDQRSYGDTGIQISSPTPGTYPNLVQWTWYLPPNLGNVGATYRAYTSNPLAPTGAAQTYQPTGVGAGPSPVFAPPLATPSVARSEAVVRFSLARGGDVRLDVVDIAGRVVRTLVAARLDAGETTLRWTLTDAAGRPVPNGVYELRLTSGGREATGRVVIMR